jgi:hypothetical protein
MAASRASRVPNADGVIWRSASISSANGRTGSRMARPAAAARTPDAGVAGGLRDAGHGGGGGGDGNGDGQAAEAGEPVADVLGQHDVDAPADGGQGREREAGGVDVAPPGLGEHAAADQKPGYANRSRTPRPEPANATALSGWLTSAHTASRERPRTSAIAAMVGKAGVATRPDSILRRVSGETPASSAVWSIERSPRAWRRNAPRRLPRSTSAGVCGNRTMKPILVPG